MLEDVDQLVKRYPQSSWTADALFGAGNFYWVNLDRARAAEFYRRSLDISPDGKNAPTAEWRLAWTAYLDRKPEAADMLEAYVRRFPLVELRSGRAVLARALLRALGKHRSTRGIFISPTPIDFR